MSFFEEGILSIYRRRRDSAECFEFQGLKSHANLNHGCFTRSVGGDPSIIGSLLKLPCVVTAEQTHGSNVAVVSGDEGVIPGCDGLITNVDDCALLIRHADCQVALMYDPVADVIAAVHSGWRGSVANIYAVTIEKMVSCFDSHPSDILVGISPSLGPRFAEFKNCHEVFPGDFFQFELSANYFDFWSISRWQLVQCGVLPENIEVAELCTYEHDADFFSARREKTSDRNGSYIVKREFGVRNERDF